MINSVIDSEILDYEKQILYFLQKDDRYIKEAFKSSHIDFNRFKDENVKKIVEIIVNYYEKYNSLLTKREFENIIENLFQSKEITEEKHGELLSTYEESESQRLDDNQFNRIFSDWLNRTCVPEVEEIFKRNHSKYLSKGLGIDFVESVRRELDELYLLKKDQSLIKIYDLDDRNEDQIKDLVRRREEDLTGIPTYIKKLDDKFIGFEGGTITLIGAITGGGKSTFAMNVSRNIFENEKDPKNVLVISLEMSERQWFRKYNIMDAFYSGLHLPYTDVLRGNKTNITEELILEFEEHLKNRKEKHKKLGVQYKVIEARANKYTWEEILGEWKRKLPNFKPDIVFIDYLALLKLGESVEQRNVALGNLTKDIRSYAQDKNIPIVVIVQANRASVSKVKGKREVDINFENIEGSNQVGSDADNFIALMSNENDLSEFIAKIVKQRDGPQATIKLRSAFDYCAIYDDDDVSKNSYLSSGGPLELEGLEDTGLNLEENLNEFIESMNGDSLESLTAAQDDCEDDEVSKLTNSFAKSIGIDGNDEIMSNGLPTSFIRAKKQGMFDYKYNRNMKNMIDNWMKGKNDNLFKHI